MLYLAIFFFVLATIPGSLLLMDWLVRTKPPRQAVLWHGLLALAGLGFLVAANAGSDDRQLTESLVLFLLAAALGFYLYYLDVKKKNVPVALAGLHALIAAIAFFLLLVLSFKR